MKKLIFIISIITILTSCNSDDDTSPQTNFYALTVGNSWVYKHYTYNNDTSTYNETGVTDSISIVGTEEIYGDTFYKFKISFTNSDNNYSDFEEYYFLRDYEGNLIDEKNQFFFSYTNHDEILVKEWGSSKEFFKLQDDEQEITTDAGIFNCTYAKKQRTNIGDNEPYLITNIYRKDGVGFIKSNTKYTYNGEEYLSQTVLVSYSVN